jgi:release factor glutamine methyltransferase
MALDRRFEGQSTIHTALRWAAEALTGTETAGLDAQLLLGHVLGRDRAWVLAHKEHPLDEAARQAYRSLVGRRALGEPVAYLRGKVPWRDLELEIEPGVLIPRPETEDLVDVAIEVASRAQARRVADIGTGSGAIAIALARALPDATLTAVDVSESALRVAKKNVERYGLAGRIAVAAGSLLEPIKEEPELVVANLPYLSDERMSSLPRDVGFEPELALHGGLAGMDVYAELVRSLAARGWRSALVFEIDPDQKAEVEALLRSTWPDCRVCFVHDLAGRVRVAVCERHQETAW